MLSSKTVVSASMPVESFWCDWAIYAASVIKRLFLHAVLTVRLKFPLALLLIMYTILEEFYSSFGSPTVGPSFLRMFFPSTPVAWLSPKSHIFAWKGMDDITLCSFIQDPKSDDRFGIMFFISDFPCKVHYLCVFERWSPKNKHATWRMPACTHFRTNSTCNIRYSEVLRLSSWRLKRTSRIINLNARK